MSRASTPLCVLAALFVFLPACQSFGTPTEAERAQMRTLEGNWKSVKLESPAYEDAGIHAVDLELDAEAGRYRWTSITGGDDQPVEGDFRVDGSWLIFGASPGRSEGRMRFSQRDGRLILTERHTNLHLELVRSR